MCHSKHGSWVYSTGDRSGPGLLNSIILLKKTERSETGTLGILGTLDHFRHFLYTHTPPQGRTAPYLLFWWFFQPVFWRRRRGILYRSVYPRSQKCNPETYYSQKIFCRALSAVQRSHRYIHSEDTLPRSVWPIHWNLMIGCTDTRDNRCRPETLHSGRV